MICTCFTNFGDLLLTTNNRADSVPRWRGLNHFTKYLAVEFTDGSKWEDMSKVRYSKQSDIVLLKDICFNRLRYVSQ